VPFRENEKTLLLKSVFPAANDELARLLGALLRA